MNMDVSLFHINDVASLRVVYAVKTFANVAAAI